MSENIWTCPYCGAPSGSPTSGDDKCRYCGCEFEVDEPEAQLQLEQDCELGCQCLVCSESALEQEPEFQPIECDIQPYNLSDLRVSPLSQRTISLPGLFVALAVVGVVAHFVFCTFG